MLESAVTERDVTEDERGTCLEAAFRELAAIYEHIGRDGVPADGGRLLDLEETIASRPAESFREAIMRVRALIAMREAEGGPDEVLLTGLRSVLNDLIRFSDRHREL